jgi:hypothetical protein
MSVLAFWCIHKRVVGLVVAVEEVEFCINIGGEKWS